jgi:pimeloyl-ACP methyl ester carboxylesterase
MQHNISFVSVDRPGHGLSDSQSNRTLVGWARDIEQLVDHLNIDQFYVEGWGAGGPHALATAFELKERVVKGALLSSIAPLDLPDPYQGLSPQTKEMVMDARNGNLTGLLEYHESMIIS